jgi:hypothetical protein
VVDDPTGRGDLGELPPELLAQRRRHERDQATGVIDAPGTLDAEEAGPQPGFAATGAEADQLGEPIEQPEGDREAEDAEQELLPGGKALVASLADETKLELKSCLVYLMPGGGSIEKAERNGGPEAANEVTPYFEEPVVWSGS